MFVKKNLKINILKIKNYKKLEIIIIIQVNPDFLHIVHIIQSILYLKELFCFSVMDLSMSHKRVRRII